VSAGREIPACGLKGSAGLSPEVFHVVRVHHGTACDRRRRRQLPCRRPTHAPPLVDTAPQRCTAPAEGTRPRPPGPGRRGAPGDVRGLRHLRQVLLAQAAVQVAQRGPGALAGAHGRVRGRLRRRPPALALRLGRGVPRAAAAEQQRLLDLSACGRARCPPDALALPAGCSLGHKGSYCASAEL